GRGSKCGDRGAMVVESSGRGQMAAESGDRGQMDVESYGRGGMGSRINAIGTDSGGRGGRSDGRETMRSVRGRRGGSKGRRGGGRGGRRDDTRKSMEDEHMQGLLVEQENLRQKQEKEQQDKLDEEALQQAREEDLMFKRIDMEKGKRIATMCPSVQPTSCVPASDNAAKKKGKRTRSEPDVPQMYLSEYITKKQRKAQYLHRCCLWFRLPPYWHGYSNVLLDEKLAAKISHFEVSRISPANQLGTTNVYNCLIKGTIGYMDAKYFLNS
nr:serine/threonine/dual specificity protein kinase, catalytic domain-containing protein [Tanacetum cinerariifolium]